MNALSPLLLWTTVLCGQVAAPADDDLKLQVRRLVRQLDAAELAERDAAEAALVKLGPKLVELDLLPTDQRMSEEVKQRLSRVRQKLQRAAAEAAAQPAPITLHGDALPLTKILAALEQQSGNKIVDFRKQFGHPETDPTLKVDFDKTPFWEALDQVLDRAGLTVYPFAEGRAIHVVGRPEGRLGRTALAAYSGPFRFEPATLTAKRDLRVPGDDALLLDVEIAWEPRLRPIGIRQQMSDLKAVDENGGELVPADAKAGLESTAGDDTVGVHLILPLKLPPRDVKQIARLTGSLQAILPGKIETFAFDDLLKAKKVEKRIAGVTVTLDEMLKNRDVWQARMRVKYDEAGDALQSHRGWIFKNEAYLEGPDGKPIAFESFETTRLTADEVGVAYNFFLDEGQSPAKCKFVYKTPSVLISTSFPYELKGLKLP